MANRARIFLVAIAALSGPAGAQDEVPVTLFSPEGCVAWTRTADKPIEKTRGVVLGACRNGRIDGYALVLLELRGDLALLAAKFDNGRRSLELAPMIVRPDGRSVFGFDFAHPRLPQTYNYPDPDTGFEHWRRHVRALADGGWRENLRVPQFWPALAGQLGRHGRRLVPGEAAPGAEAEKITGENWPQGWEALARIPGWVWIDAGTCVIVLFEPNHRQYPNARHDWNGSCAQNLAEGTGVHRRYTAAGKLDFIVRAEANTGWLRQQESYFRSDGSGPIMARKASGNSTQVPPSEVADWAQEIVDGRPR